MGRAYDKKTLAIVERRLKRGEHAATVARKVGRSHASVSRMARKHGWPTNAFLSPWRVHQIRDMWLQGFTIEELAVIHAQAESRIKAALASESDYLDRHEGEEAPPVSGDPQGDVP